MKSVNLKWIVLASLGGVLFLLFALATLPAPAAAGTEQLGVQAALSQSTLQTDGDVWIAVGERAGANLGQEVAAAGDVNGDGYADLLVSAKAFNGSLYDARALAFYGSANGLSATPDWSVTNDQPDSQFGRVLAPAGDVNGDGYDDVLVGAPYFDDGENTDAGRAYLYYGSATGLSTTPGWTADGGDYVSYFSSGLGGAGDVNGDGYDDVVVGETYWTDPETGDWGRVSLFLGSSSGPGETAAWTAQGNPTYGRFGAPTTGAGDVNGDGYDDILIAEPSFWGDQDQEGRVYLYHGGPDGPSAQPDWIDEGDQDNAYYGNAMSGAGDVNGDGYDDVIIGAWYFDDEDFNEGRAYVYHGGATGLSAEPDWLAEGDQYTARFGVSVDAAGDANGDGYDDVLVGADAIDNGQMTEGRGYLFAGGPDGVGASPILTVEGDQEEAYFARAVAGPGDVDGNGIPELAFGAPNYDWAETDDGIVLVQEAGATSPLPTPEPATPTPTPEPPTPTPTPAGTMHVADLDATSTNAGSTWTASVTVRIVTAAGDPLADASVRGIWTRNGTGIGVGTCTTDSSGACTISKSDIRKRNKSVTFHVDVVTHPTHTYDETANGDPDGDSDGNTITVQR